MIKLGVIGIGKMGGYHSSICQTLPKVKLIGIADPNEENLKKIKSTKIKKTADFQDWLQLVDGVIISVPTEFHFDIAKKCLEQDKHILLEKPLTKTVKEAETLFLLAKKHNVSLHVGHVERFNGAVQELKKIISEPYLIESHRMGPFTTRVQSDTVVLDLMIHDLDIITGLVDSPVKRVSAMGKSIKSDLPDLVTVQLQFENGVIANISSSRVSHIKKRTMSIHQKNSYVHLDFTTQDISIHHHKSTSVKVGYKEMKYRQEENVERLFVYKDNPLKLEIEHFVKSIKTGKNKFNPDQDIETLKLTLKIENLLRQQEETSYARSHSRNRNTTSCSL